MSNRLVVAGISTEVGKTIIAALLVETLKADYWKPIQSGSKTDSDTRTVKALVSNSKSVFHPEAYLLSEPLSPHAAAEIDKVKIELDQINVPQTTNNLIIELAGGLMVPLDHKTMNLDLLKQWNYPVVLVANFYLGSINHTLLSIELLKQYHIPIHSLIFNGPVTTSSKDVILAYSGIKDYVEIPTFESLDRQSIQNYAQQLTTRF